MNSQQRALLERIEAFPMDEALSQQPLVSRLARANGWRLEFARRAVREYRRFMFLVCEAGHPCCPSDEVDQVWHLHLTYTRNYWRDFCGEVLGRPVHHDPSKGGSNEHHKHVTMYLDTLASYE